MKKCRDKHFSWKHAASLIISGGTIRPLVPICLLGFEVMSLFLHVAQFTRQHAYTHEFTQSMHKYTNSHQSYTLLYHYYTHAHTLAHSRRTFNTHTCQYVN